MADNTSDLLVEIICEEIPARMQAQAAVDLAKLVKMSNAFEELTPDPACDASVVPKSVFKSAKVMLTV